MKKYRNIGHHERVIRIGIGLLLLALSGVSLFPGWGDLALVSIGLIALLTGIIGYCPAWQVFGINTCPLQKTGHSPSQADASVHEHADPSSHRS
ncbi:MAG: DUF2892 domain-containing protein [Nitrospira sp.]|nr:DUF2892 domain-containing protein [Nitrospira sp.]HBP88994.1 hypothetical protein [Nitrospiraceae bacterium]HNP29411.1 DUF2892 domain-containing protein [Nitrospirales bacterium]